MVADASALVAVGDDAQLSVTLTERSSARESAPVVTTRRSCTMEVPPAVEKVPWAWVEKSPDPPENVRAKCCALSFSPSWIRSADRACAPDG